MNQLVTRNEDGVRAAIIRGDLIEAANDLGYELNSSLTAKMQAMSGAIVVTDGNDIDVRTFEDEEELEDCWSTVAAVVESKLEAQEQLED